LGLFARLLDHEMFGCQTSIPEDTEKDFRENGKCRLLNGTLPFGLSHGGAREDGSWSAEGLFIQWVGESQIEVIA